MLAIIETIWCHFGGSEKMIFKARSVIAESLNNKDENTAKWLLERKLKDEFSTKTESNINVNGEVALVKWK